jgi:hypothetical protein
MPPEMRMIHWELFLIAVIFIELHTIYCTLFEPEKFENQYQNDLEKSRNVEKKDRTPLKTTPRLVIRHLYALATIALFWTPLIDFCTALITLSFVVAITEHFLHKNDTFNFTGYLILMASDAVATIMLVVIYCLYTGYFVHGNILKTTWDILCSNG